MAIDISTAGVLGSSNRTPGVAVARVEISSAVLVLRVLALGAAIESCEVPDAAGRWANVHLRLGSLAEYEDRARNPYLGATIGRYANRIEQSRFILDGHEVQLLANEGPNHLHGGPDGFDRQVWEIVATTATDDGGSVTFGLSNPAGDQGYPGALSVTATYEVAGDLICTTLEAETDAPTIVNLTNHAYWNLDGASTIADHHLALAADEVLPVGDDGIPTGGLVAVARTPFDLRTRRRLGAVLDALPGGVDHCVAVRGAPGVLRPAAVLDAPASGRWLAVRTDQPGLQVYTGNALGAPFVPHGAIALESQRLPDTPNRPELGSAVLRPGERYTSVTELRFGAGSPPPSLS